MFKKLKKNKFILTAILVLLVGSFLVGDTAFAKEEICGWSQALNPLCWGTYFLLGFMWLGSSVIGLLITMLAALLTLNNFTTASAVKIGWTTVRDLANMFFVLIVLAIAIGTILRIESYNLKKALPRVVIMAVMVNFSLLIFGLITDFAQVIMASFVRIFQEGFKTDLLIEALGLTGFVEANPGSGPPTTTPGQTELSTFLTTLFGAIMMVIAGMVIFVMLVVLVLRTIMLWLLAVLSPLPYVFSAFPQGRTYASMWWSEFIKYVIIGPAFAFFLWLSLAVLASSTTGDIIGDSTVTSGLTGATSEGGDVLFSEGATAESFIKFIIAIGMLLGGLILTQRAGVAGGGLAGNMYGRIRGAGVKAALAPLNLGKFAAGGAAGLGWAGAKIGLRWGGRQLDTQQRRLQRYLLTQTKAGRILTGQESEDKARALREAQTKRIDASAQRKLGAINTVKESELGRIETQKQQKIESSTRQEQDRIDATRKSTENLKARGLLNEDEYTKKMAALDQRQSKVDDIKSRIEQSFESQQETVKAKYKPQEEAILQSAEARKEATIEPAKKPGAYRKVMDKIASEGLTGNYRMWQKGFKDFRGRRMNDYEAGLGSTVHDLGSLITTFGKESTNYSFIEEQSKINEQKKLIDSISGGDTDIVLQELSQAIDSNDRHRIAAAQMILAENIDENEPFKGEWAEKMAPHMQRALQTQFKVGSQMPVYDDKGNNTGKTTTVTDNTISDLMKQWRQGGTVNPAFMNVFNKNVLKDAFGNEDLAARVSKVIGIQALSNGSGIVYGGEKHNADTGKMEFIAPVLKQDASGNISLDISSEQSHNVSGKISMIQPRSYLARMSPRNIGIEGVDGKIKGLSMLNKSNLVKLFNESIMKNVAQRGHEFKPDILGKPIDSKEWRDAIKDFSKDLEDNWQDYQSAGFAISSKKEAQDQAKRIRELPMVIANTLGRRDVIHEYVLELGGGTAGKEAFDKIITRYAGGKK